MTTTTTLPAAFDSAEWVVSDYEAELLGEGTSYTEDYDLLRTTAVEYVAGKLATHWLSQGRPVTLVSADMYGQGTWSDEAINVTASSYYLPSEEEARALWSSIVADVTPDEIRQIAGL